MYSGFSIEKLLLIGLIAGLLIGPERLPRYAAALGRLTKRVREFTRTATDRVRSEMGEDFDDVDWKTLDPRQYDPRRIIREALIDETPATPPKPQSGPGPGDVVRQKSTTLARGEKPPFDLEAT